jgi:hypothetical protein
MFAHALGLTIPAGYNEGNISSTLMKMLNSTDASIRDAAFEAQQKQIDLLFEEPKLKKAGFAYLAKCQKDGTTQENTPVQVINFEA